MVLSQSAAFFFPALSNVNKEGIQDGGKKADKTVYQSRTNESKLFYPISSDRL